MQPARAPHPLKPAPPPPPPTLAPSPVDRIIFLHEGRVVWQGSVAEFDTTDEPIVRQFASGSLNGPIRYE